MITQQLLILQGFLAGLHRNPVLKLRDMKSTEVVKQLTAERGNYLLLELVY